MLGTPPDMVSITHALAAEGWFSATAGVTATLDDDAELSREIADNLNV